MNGLDRSQRTIALAVGLALLLMICVPAYHQLIASSERWSWQMYDHVLHDYEFTAIYPSGPKPLRPSEYTVGSFAYAGLNDRVLQFMCDTDDEIRAIEIMSTDPEIESHFPCTE